MTNISLIDELKRRPSMFLRKIDYNSCVAFLKGADVALNGALLIGFGDGLRTRTNKGSNLSWQQKVLFVAFPEEKTPWGVVDNGDTQANQLAIQVLFECLDAYNTMSAVDT
jgi:hypothetical protein